MVDVMASNDSIVRYLNPWKHRRELERQQQRVAELRRRDGDDCRRCRRPLRFDLTDGHDLAPKIESMLSNGAAEESLDNLCLTHRRCIAEGNDHTDEVAERVRRKNEAELFAASRRRKRA
jgi:5-methylcytosine-specific restriction endonuclease McrA